MGKSGSQQTTMPLTGLPRPPAGMGYDDTGTLRPLSEIRTFGQPAPAPTPAPQPAAPAMVQPSGPNVFQQAQGYQTQAGQAFGGLAGFQAPTAQAAQIGPVGTMAQADIGQYMSPYTQQVIERGQADIARQREQAMNRLGAQASAAGAFGGSRQGVAEGVTMGEYGRMAGDFAAQQREKAYQQALGAAQYDIGQQQQRALQQANLQQQASLANQQAALSGAGIQQAGAAGLGGLGQQLFGQGMGVQQQIGQQAAFQRSLQQRLLDLQKQQFGQATGAPLSGLGAMSQIMRQTPYSTTSTTSEPFNPASLLLLL